MEETIEEEMHEEIELQHITDKSDQENVIYKNVDDDDESDVLTQVSATSSQDQSSFLISPYWLQDERLRRGVVDFLSNDEEEFWKDLIGKYLRPIKIGKHITHTYTYARAHILGVQINSVLLFLSIKTFFAL